MADNVQMVDPKQLVPNPLRQRAKTVPVPDKENGRYLMIKDSIVANGIKQPLLVQQDTAMILGGHTRCEIAIELGMDEVPVQYVEADEDEALYLLLEDNLDHAQDEQDLMKIAWQCKQLQRLEGRNPGRPKKYCPGGMFSTTNISVKLNMSERTFWRYVSLNKLIQPLQILVSAGNIGIKSGAQLANLNAEGQRKVYDSIREICLSKNYHLTEQEAKSFREAFGRKDEDDSDKLEWDTKRDLGPTFNDTEEATYEPEQIDRILLSKRPLISETLMGQGNADIADVAHEVDETMSPSIEDQSRRIKATQTEIEHKLQSLMSIQDPSARKMYAVSKVKSAIRAHELASERAGIELVAELATLPVDAYREVQEEWERLTTVYEGVTEKLERVLEKMKLSRE